MCTHQIIVLNTYTKQVVALYRYLGKKDGPVLPTVYSHVSLIPSCWFFVLSIISIPPGERHSFITCTLWELMVSISNLAAIFSILLCTKPLQSPPLCIDRGHDLLFKITVCSTWYYHIMRSRLRKNLTHSWDWIPISRLVHNFRTILRPCKLLDCVERIHYRDVLITVKNIHGHLFQWIATCAYISLLKRRHGHM